MSTEDDTQKAKGRRYAEAWWRIREARANGFYFEVVTLCESIISDRLLSYIVGKHEKANERTNFGSLIEKWKKLAGENLPSFESSNLADAVDDWREHRNEVVHGITKSLPGTAMPPLEEFIVRARETAERGAVLARLVSNWHRQQLREHLKTSDKGDDHD
ncbi:hypothetical protein PQR05_03905 [Paraburkholderia sediminicola]|uniref:hypothetical protein n=1 Tax=Paraburkholderia sediminicola TaxID=458836 RepID=UPI0038B9CE73